MNANNVRDPQSAEYWGERPCLRAPIPEMFEAADELSLAADAFLRGDLEECAKLVVAADKCEIREWIESLWGSEDSNPLQPVYHRRRKWPKKPPVLNRDVRHPTRMPTSMEKMAIIERWGWNCAYCGGPLVHSDARKILMAALGPRLRWGPRNVDKHSAFQCMTIEFDHVVPHAVGGTSDIQNTVPSCGPCNCGKFDRTLEEHGLEDPRQQSVVKTAWDGLTRLLPARKY